MLTLFSHLSCNPSDIIYPPVFTGVPIHADIIYLPVQLAGVPIHAYLCTFLYLAGVSMYHSILTLLYKYLPTCPDWCPGTSHKQTVRADRNPLKK
jgi:hypothetical protein